MASGDSSPSIAVPLQYPTLVEALHHAEPGSTIEIASGHQEYLPDSLIIDKTVVIEGPQGLGGFSASAPLLFGEESIIVATESSTDFVALKRLRFSCRGGLPTVVLASGCVMEECDIESSGVGVDVLARSGGNVRLISCRLHHCQVGISFKGSFAAATLEGTNVERCRCGLVLTGLEVTEGWNTDTLTPLVGVALVENEDADLMIHGWDVKEQAYGTIRRAPPGGEVSVRGWPRESCSTVAGTDLGPVVLHFNGPSINATLFEQDHEGSASGSDDDDDVGEFYDASARQT